MHSADRQQHPRRGLAPFDQFGLAGVAAAVSFAYLYWPAGIPGLVTSLLVGTSATSLGYIRARPRLASPPTSGGRTLTRSAILPLLGFVLFYGVLILAAAGVGEAVDRNLPDDDPVELGAVVGGGLSGALMGISLGARVSRRRRL